MDIPCMPFHRPARAAARRRPRPVAALAAAGRLRWLWLVAAPLLLAGAGYRLSAAAGLNAYESTVTIRVNDRRDALPVKTTRWYVPPVDRYRAYLDRPGFLGAPAGGPGHNAEGHVGWPALPFDRAASRPVVEVASDGIGAVTLTVRAPDARTAESRAAAAARRIVRAEARDLGPEVHPAIAGGPSEAVPSRAAGLTWPLLGAVLGLLVGAGLGVLPFYVA